jgi:hypothetical protein
MNLVYRSIVAFALCGAVCSAAVGPATAQSKTKPAVAPRQVQVYLFRGLADIFSRGMDTLTDRLNREGYAARVYSHRDWQSVAHHIAQRHARGDRDIVVLIGHSLGADATLQIANSLARSNVPVDLIVTFDGTHPHFVPGNVHHLVNFYQNNGFGKKISAGPGFAGQLDNVDLSADSSLSHVTIDKSHRLHAQAIAKIAAIVDQDVAKARKARKPKAKKSPPPKPLAAAPQTGKP